VFSDILKLQVWDQNDNGKEEDDLILGSIPIEISKIASGTYSSPFWQNIYGSPVNNDNKETIKMNLNPEYASNWKGRILM